jgi:hypothetical protein
MSVAAEIGQRILNSVTRQVDGLHGRIERNLSTHLCVFYVRTDRRLTARIVDVDDARFDLDYSAFETSNEDSTP